MSFLLSECKELDYSHLVSINGGCSGSAGVISYGGGPQYNYPNGYSGSCSGSGGSWNGGGSGSTKGGIEIFTSIDPFWRPMTGGGEIAYISDPQNGNKVAP